jgi:large subunit ribosomal protein L29
MLSKSEIEKLDSDAILSKIGELRKELFDLRLQKATTNVEKTHLLREHKRDIARLLTVKNSREESK